jgi:hypothetical protein
MGLRDFLKNGGEVVGSQYDGKVENLLDMSIESATKQGYSDKDGYWTDLGYQRATTKDYEDLGAPFKKP